MRPQELRQRRTRAGLTQPDLAEMCGIGQPEISRMERGLEPIGPDRARRLTEALDAFERKRDERRRQMRRAVEALRGRPTLEARRRQHDADTAVHNATVSERPTLGRDPVAAERAAQTARERAQQRRETTCQ